MKTLGSRGLLAAFSAAALLSGCGGGGPGYGSGGSPSGGGGLTPAPGDLVITEVLAHPADGSATKEWFEVYNRSIYALQLDGMVVTANATTFTVPAGVSIPSGQYFVFAASNVAADNAGLPVVNVVYTGLTLADTSLTLSLILGVTTLDTVTFTTSTAGASLSLDPAKQDPTSNDNVATNWCLSTGVYGDGSNKGTPGATGATCP